MSPVQRLPASLSPLEPALAALLADLGPVDPVELGPAQALGCVAADPPPSRAWPAADIATADGFALRAQDLVGATSYSPVPLPAAPMWVEAGEALPPGCDCVVDPDLIDLSGPVAQVLAEAIPGQGLRRAGSELAPGSAAIVAGSSIRPLDLLLARATGMERLRVRRPRLRLVNVPGGWITATLIAESARQAGLEVSVAEAASREAEAIAAELDPAGHDLVITIGGSGGGRTDAAVAALARRGVVRCHGFAMRPGRTAAIGNIGAVAVLALPGAPDQAMAVWWTLALPALDRLAGRAARPTLSLPLARKIASSVGIAEVALLERHEDAWMPLAVGDLSLRALSRADGWLLVPGDSEGFPASSPAAAYMVRE